MNKTKTETQEKGVVSSILVIVFSILLVFLAVRIVTSKIKNEPYFLFGKYSVVWVMTESMEDAIPAQSFILIEKADASKVKENDVITFHSTDPQILGQLNTHRIVANNEAQKSFTTKGDHNAVQDTYTVPYENVVGKYVKNLTVLTAIAGAFLSGWGFIVLCGIVVIITGMFMIRLFTQKDDDDEENEQSEMDKRIAEEVEKLKLQGYVPEKTEEKKENEQDKNE